MHAHTAWAAATLLAGVFATLGAWGTPTVDLAGLGMLGLTIGTIVAAVAPHTSRGASARTRTAALRTGAFAAAVFFALYFTVTAQRRRCEADILRRPAPTDATIRTALDRRGHADTPFTLDHSRGEVVIHAVLPTNTAAALTHDLGIRVRVARQHSDTYWSSGTAGALPLVIGDAG